MTQNARPDKGRRRFIKKMGAGIIASTLVGTGIGSADTNENQLNSLIFAVLQIKHKNVPDFRRSYSDDIEDYIVGKKDKTVALSKFLSKKTQRKFEAANSLIDINGEEYKQLPAVYDSGDRDLLTIDESTKMQLTTKAQEPIVEFSLLDDNTISARVGGGGISNIPPGESMSTKLDPKPVTGNIRTDEMGTAPDPNSDGEVRFRKYTEPKQKEIIPIVEVVNFGEVGVIQMEDA